MTWLAVVAMTSSKCHCEAPPFGAEAVSTLGEEIATAESAAARPSVFGGRDDMVGGGRDDMVGGGRDDMVGGGCDDMVGGGRDDMVGG